MLLGLLLKEQSGNGRESEKNPATWVGEEGVVGQTVSVASACKVREKPSSSGSLMSNIKEQVSLDPSRDEGSEGEAISKENAGLPGIEEPRSGAEHHLCFPRGRGGVLRGLPRQLPFFTPVLSGAVDKSHVRRALRGRED
ncbi:hypothetical protein DPEC_G00261760 [Dallia pectoralis]|uniref:Uncharacterized protein n=1 Tax=Dallia pectoralis TaxID=75939 RepID=A0ACC2FRQ2_DALPE|nr:hypothetical protein DPEC_G00261760 [Dallia pectoralis]